MRTPIVLNCRRFTFPALFFALLIIGGLALSGGVLFTPRKGNGRHLNRVGMTPLPGETFNGRLVLFFDGNLRIPETEEETGRILKFKPPLKGKTRIQDNFISFSTGCTISENTIYSVEIGSNLRSVDGQKINPPQRRFTLATFLFKPQSIWLDSEPKESAVVGVSFPTAVDRNQLAEHLELLSANQNSTIIGVKSDGDNCLFRITLNQTAETSFALILRENLQDRTGLLETVNRYEYVYDPALLNKSDSVQNDSVEKPQPLIIQSVESDNAGRDGLVVSLRLSWNLQAKDLLSNLKFEPAVTNIRIVPDDLYSFRIYGDLLPEQLYKLTIAPGVRNSLGRTNDKPVSGIFMTGRYSRYLNFAENDKFYFPREDDASLTLETRNIKKGALRIYRLFPSNIAVALREINSGDVYDSLNYKWCEEIKQSDVVMPYRKNALVKKTIPFSEILPSDKKGVFCAEFSYDTDSEDEENYNYYECRDIYRLILSTNIGLLSHWNKDELSLFVHDLYTMKPLHKAEVSLYSTKNQLIAAGSTDESGILRLKDFEARLGEPSVLVAEYQGDYSFLELTPREEDRDFDPDLPNYNPGDFEAFLYADRSLYRPGELVHLHWIARKNFGEVPGAMPLLFRVLKPDGKPLMEKAVMLSEMGTGGEDVQTHKANPTGLYTAELLVPGQDTVIGEYAFHLEEFVPNRLKAAVRPASAAWIIGNSYPFHVSSKHFSGAPASGRKCEGFVRLEPDPQPFEHWTDYHFGNDSEVYLNDIQCGQQVLDDVGGTTFTINLPAKPEWTFPMEATIVGRVFELGGRPVIGKSKALIFPSAICPGLAISPARNKNKLEVCVAAVHPDGSPVPQGTMMVTLEKECWDYYVRRYYSHNESNWTPTRKEIETREVAILEGRGTAHFEVPDYGYYRVRVHSPETVQYSTLNFYSYGDSFSVSDESEPALIKIIADKDSYNIGERVRVRLEAPFDGWCLFVLQGSAIHEMFPVEIKNKVGTASFDIPPDYFPGVWLEATVIHRIEKEHVQVYPLSSFAKKRITINDPRNKLDMKFEALQKEIRPEQKAPVTICVLDFAGKPVEAELTLAAVDEGIHSIIGYVTPDPCGWLTRARRPDLRRAHYYDRVVFNFDKPETGGDGGLDDIANRIGMSQLNWIKTVAVWSGTVKTDREGRAIFNIDVPDYSGRLRLVAVGCSGEAVGSCDDFVTVKRPCDFDVSLPRFLMPEDSAICAAVIFNHTGNPVDARLQWHTDGSLNSEDGEAGTEVPANKDAVLTFPIRARSVTGGGLITWTATYTDRKTGEAFVQKKETHIPVNTPVFFQIVQETKALKPGDKWMIQNNDFLPEPVVSGHMVVGATPFLRLSKALQYVLGYPHGCVEQTTSRLMPLYILRHHEALTSVSLPGKVRPDVFIRAGIDRLFSMQTISGGLAYWPGSKTPSPYGSIYALHFLTLIQKDDSFDIPEQEIKDLRGYVRIIAESSNGDSDEELLTRAYAVFVIALNDEPDAMDLVERFENMTLPEPARVLLAAALSMHSPDAPRVKKFLAGPAEPYMIAASDPTFASDVRNKAMELLALTKMSAEPSIKAGRAEELIRFLEGNPYASTQEMAFIATALGEYFSQQGANLNNASAEISGPEGIRRIRGGEFFHDEWKGSEAECSVANTGKSDIFISLTREGIPRIADDKPVSDGISIRRVFHAQNGGIIEKPEFRRGDSYIVALEMDCPTSVYNLIISDLLPAGFEIENPRLDADCVPRINLDVAMLPAHFEMRDDRVILAFDELSKGASRYYYIVRAVTAGTFSHPPVHVECMYNPSIRASVPASVIEIHE